MLMNTRRRMLGLLAAAFGASRLLPPIGPAFAKPAQCFAKQAFGEWTALATQTQAGARMGEVTFTNADNCNLRAEIQVSANFESKLVVYGDPDTMPLPKDFLIKPDNRLVVRKADGTAVMDEQLCGVCNEIHDEKVTVILPLALAPLLREGPSVEIALKLGEQEECRFTLDGEVLRKALDWATERRQAHAEDYQAQKCTATDQECFITTACCELLGLPDNCFELRLLRRYRDRVLARLPGGREKIALYYR